MIYQLSFFKGSVRYTHKLTDLGGSDWLKLYCKKFGKYFWT